MIIINKLTDPKLSKPLSRAILCAKSLSMLLRNRTKNELVNTSDDDNAPILFGKINSSPNRHNHFNSIAPIETITQFFREREIHTQDTFYFMIQLHYYLFMVSILSIIDWIKFSFLVLSFIFHINLIMLPTSWTIKDS